MRNFRKEYTVKFRLMKFLLSCLSYGSNVKCDENYINAVSKKLKVQYPFDAKRIRSCIDLIEDTELAIISFSKYGLEKFSPRMNSNEGDKYLRLYGILNAVQQQKLAIFELIEVLKISNKTKLKHLLNDLKIVEIRNVFGAHTINLNDIGPHKSNEIKTNFFRITRIMLTDKADNIHAVDGFGNVRIYNLYESCLEYNRVSEKILYDGIIEYADRILINIESKKQKLIKDLNLTFFNHHDYSALYQNEKLFKRYFKKSSNNINKEMVKEFGVNWRVDFNKKVEYFSLDDFLPHPPTKTHQKISHKPQ